MIKKKKLKSILSMQLIKAKKLILPTKNQLRPGQSSLCMVMPLLAIGIILVIANGFTKRLTQDYFPLLSPGNYVGTISGVSPKTATTKTLLLHVSSGTVKISSSVLGSDIALSPRDTKGMLIQKGKNLIEIVEEPLLLEGQDKVYSVVSGPRRGASYSGKVYAGNGDRVGEWQLKRTVVFDPSHIGGKHYEQLDMALNLQTKKRALESELERLIEVRKNLEEISESMYGYLQQHPQEPPPEVPNSEQQESSAVLGADSGEMPAGKDSAALALVEDLQFYRRTSVEGRAVSVIQKMADRELTYYLASWPGAEEFESMIENEKMANELSLLDTEYRKALAVLDEVNKAKSLKEEISNLQKAYNNKLHPPAPTQSEPQNATVEVGSEEELDDTAPRERESIWERIFGY